MLFGPLCWNFYNSYLLSVDEIEFCRFENCFLGCLRSDWIPLGSREMLRLRGGTMLPLIGVPSSFMSGCVVPFGGLNLGAACSGLPLLPSRESLSLPFLNMPSLIELIRWGLSPGWNIVLNLFINLSFISSSIW